MSFFITIILIEEEYNIIHYMYNIKYQLLVVPKIIRQLFTFHIVISLPFIIFTKNNSLFI